MANVCHISPCISINSIHRVLVLTNLAKGSTASISPDDPTLGDDSVGPGALSALAAPTIVYTALATVRHPLAGTHVGPFLLFTKGASGIDIIANPQYGSV